MTGPGPRTVRAVVRRRNDAVHFVAETGSGGRVPIDGSPAQKAGLLAGDVITAIDGASVAGLTLDGAVNKVRGPRDTQVTLTIQRAGTAAPIQLTITRAAITVKDVTSKTLENGTVGYIKIAHFSENVGKDFHTALKAFVDQWLHIAVEDGSFGKIYAAWFE